MNKDLELKGKLYSQCINLINKRLEVIQSTIQDIQESLTSETKSSAGDKHETGRAMLQLEREKAGNQLAEIQRIKMVMSKIQPDKKLEHVSLGAVVFTSQANYFIAVSTGEIKMADEVFYAISPKTPMGQFLIGKQAGDEFSFRGQVVKIECVV